MVGICLVGNVLGNHDKDGLMNKDEYKDKDKYNCKAKDTERQTNDKNTDILGTIGHWVKIANCLQQ